MRIDSECLRSLRREYRVRKPKAERWRMSTSKCLERAED